MNGRQERLLHVRREREQTDSSLRDERQRTDTTLANLSAYRLADAAAELERNAADRVVRLERRREDKDDQTHEADADEIRRTLEQERLRADEALRTERIRADEALDREREERAEVEAATFDRERQRTDGDLGEERDQTDGIIDHERSAKWVAEGAAAEAADGLRGALEKAREALAARNAFLSVAAHELRTPLNTLQLQVQGFLQTAPSDGAMQGRLKRVQAQVDRLDKLVNDLLDVSRITVGRLPLDLRDMDLAALVSEVVERDREVLERAKCELRVDATGPVIGRWDRQRLDQVVSNLLSNACKFGAEKPIRIVVEGDERSARLVVEDQGIGISPADSARIFQRFGRAVSERNFGGLGLGLWLVRQIVEAHGGTVAVDGAVGVGARFTVELPRSLDHPPGT